MRSGGVGSEALAISTAGISRVLASVGRVSSLEWSAAIRGCTRWPEKARLNPATSKAEISVARTGGMICFVEVRRTGTRLTAAARIGTLPLTGLDWPQVAAALRRERGESR